ncbi:MAG: UbiA-like polyprenyltransferase [Planctomycetota bacterium]
MSEITATNTLGLALRDIKLAHSVFALPFALLAATLAVPENDTPARIALKISLIVACMVFARTWAMLFNRIADATIDAANERTARRAVASGELSRDRAWAFAGGAAALFVVTTAGFLAAFGNPWPLALSLPTLVFIAFYSLTKRFTLLCHVFLGAALGVSPLAATVAVDPAAFEGWPFRDGLALSSMGRAAAAGWLSLFVLAWVAGFDVIYALQDLDFDRERGLHSVPSKLGWRGAAWTSRGLHILSLAMLGLAAAADDRLGTIFIAGCLAAVALLATEHAVLIKRGREGIPMAFFTLNGVVSVVLGLAGIADVLIP